MTTDKPLPQQLPLLPQQRRLYALDMLGSATAYSFPLAYEIDGPLEAARLQQALQAVVDARPVYRANFRMEEGVPVQVIAEQRSIALEQDDAPGAEPQALFEAWRRPFDLARDLLLRARLVRTGEARHVLLLDLHHIITDLHALDLLLADLAAAYAGEPLAPEPLPYAQLLLQPPAQESAEAMAAHERFWLEQFAQGSSVGSLPADAERPALQNFHGAHRRFELRAETWEPLQQRCRQLGVDERSYLFAVFQLFVAKLSGDPKLAIGFIEHGRPQPWQDAMHGMFVRTQALPCTQPGLQRFDEHLVRLHERLAQAQQHAAYGLDRLVERLGVARDASRNPLFDLVFLFKPAEHGRFQLPGCAAKALALETHHSKFDLSLVVQPREGSLSAAFEYNTKLFGAATVERFLRSFLLLLNSTLHRPDASLASLSLLSDREQDERWHASRGPARPVQRQTMQALFEQALAAHPQQTAVISAAGSLSYAELGARVHRLARRLRSLGVGRGRMVGVVSEHGWEQAAATLAVLCAGGVYVPLHPDLPSKRLADLCRACDIELLLTQSWLQDRVAWPEGLQRIAVDDLQGYAQESELPLDLAQTPDDMAYVIFTSGTTGMPKGVVIDHLAAVNTLLDVNRRYGVGPGDRLLALSNLNFDLSVYDIFGTLAAGATVVYPAADSAKDPAHWLALVREHQVTLWNTVPALMALLCDQPDAQDLTLRCVMLSGDWIPVNLPAHIRSICREGVAVHSLGGATEASIWSITHPIVEADGQRHRIPYGRAMDNQEFHVLDEAMNPCPEGVVGELYIGGVGLAREYWRDPDRTAQAFVRHPARGGRLYRTGDLGRYLGDGEIEILGRRDHQVKINGYRIELEEIEAILLKAPGVRKAAVAVQSHDGRALLCAYLVETEAGLAGDDRVLMEHLSTQLPEYMVPQHYLRLPDLPLGANDKVDRSALPKPELAPSAKGFEAARNPTEQCLVEIWEQVLREQGIGVHDNFFRLGGDSIKAIQIASRLRERGFSLRVDDLFRYGTIAELAPNLKKAQLSSESAIQGAVGLTPICRWFQEQIHTDAHHWNQDIVLSWPGALDADVLARALLALVDHHDLLRARYAADRQALEVAAPGSVQPPLAVHALSGDDAEARMLALCNEVQAGLDLQNGPWLKALLFKAPAGDRVVLIAHHLVVDGISWRVMAEDLSLACRQLQAGQALRLPARSQSMRHWMQLLQQEAQAPRTLDELPMWQEACATFPPPCALGRVGDARQHQVSLHPSLTRELLTSAHQAYNTEINDLLLTALARALHRVRGDAALCLQLEGHGREQLQDGVDISRTVGWFTSAYPVRLGADEADPGAHILQVKKALRALPRKGVGYGILRYLAALSPDQRQSLKYQAPLNFNYLGELGGRVDDEGVQFAFGTAGQRRSPRSELLAPLDLQCLLKDGALQLRFSHDPGHWSAVEVESLAQAYLAALAELAAHCASRDQAHYTPSDFEMADVDQDELDLIARSF